METLGHVGAAQRQRSRRGNFLIWASCKRTRTDRCTGRAVVGQFFLRRSAICLHRPDRGQRTGVDKSRGGRFTERRTRPARRQRDCVERSTRRQSDQIRHALRTGVHARRLDRLSGYVALYGNVTITDTRTDKDFVDTFLLTYEYWMDSVTFLRMLITQFRVPKLRVKPAEPEAEERAKLFIQLR